MARPSILDIVDHARTCVRSVLSPSMRDTLSKYTSAFDAAHIEEPAVTLNLFVFHVEVPESHRVIDYIDVKHDHGAFDYGKLASHFLWAGSNFDRGVRVYYVTDETSALPRQLPQNTIVIRLAMDPTAPMLERVIAMNAYVQSRAFSRNTAFLDSDAYPNRSLGSIFNGRFDVGVTYRTTPGYMPLNEGVIFCSQDDREAVRNFFSAYLGTYESIMQDATIRDYYGDIKRWRGGQLSLNAVACPQVSLREIKQVKDFRVGGSRIGLLPCNLFNYWVTRAHRPGTRTWDRKFVLHLKGDSKKFIDDVIAYQVKRARA